MDPVPGYRKRAADRLNGPESVVVMSAGHNDEERLAKWHLRKDQQGQAIDRFKDRNDLLSILVVCDMLLTGFAAPVEQVMYLDQPLKEHGLLQAIARVNRPLGDEKTAWSSTTGVSPRNCRTRWPSSRPPTCRGRWRRTWTSCRGCRPGTRRR